MFGDWLEDRVPCVLRRGLKDWAGVCNIPLLKTLQSLSDAGGLNMGHLRGSSVLVLLPLHCY